MEQPNIDWPEMHRNAEKARLAPFLDLNERLDQLINTSIEMSKYTIESNTMQAKVAVEIKNSGDYASNFSRKNFFLSFVVVALTVLSVSIAFYSTYTSSKQVAVWQELGEEAIRDINDKLKNIGDLSEILSHSHLLSARQVSDMRAENSELREELEKLQSRVQELLDEME